MEGYKEGAGWALPLERTYDDQGFQNELDAATIYQILENDIAPAYYNLDSATGRSHEWIGFIKNTIAQVACDFTTNRMLTDYINQYYDPQCERAKLVKEDDFKVAREIAAWKKHVRRSWEDVQVLSRTEPQAAYDISEKSPLHSEIVLNLGDLKPEHVGVEVVFAQTDIHGQLHIDQVNELQVVDYQDGACRYAVDIMPGTTGAYQVCMRIFAKHPLLPHRQDFECVRWI